MADTATILYPTGYPTFNYIDDVEISYETTFIEGAYLVLNCDWNTSPRYFEWVDAQNPLNESGLYKWHAIGVVINGQRPLPFPTDCWFDLGPNIGSDPSPEHVYQGNFSMVSTSAPPKTWALSASNTPTAISSSTSSPHVSQPTGKTSSSLSTGAKAGIGIGAVAGFFIMFSVIFYLIQLRRREAQTKIQLAALQRERDTEKDSQKAELDSQAWTKQEKQEVVEHPEIEGRPVYEISGQPIHRV